MKFNNNRIRSAYRNLGLGKANHYKVVVTTSKKVTLIAYLV